MSQPLVALVLLLVGIAAPPAQPPGKTKKPTAQPLVCALRTPEAPRGGRLELEGQNFGKTPVVRIEGKVAARMIERTESKISVQIPADSDGGTVTLTAGSQEANCGTLIIIGKN